MSAVRVEGLGKRYRIGAREEGRDTLAAMAFDAVRSPVRNLRRLRGLTRFASEDEENTIWALRDVSFALEQGDVLGVIGRNGAGKSTLLKILSRIVEPSEGRAVLRGRTASLLEVGTGFHNELTGRENVFLNGAILGMRRRQIEQRFDEIVDFADLATFIDTPVKRYSSGMYLRLAFAVAAHLDFDILFADEVLAVGDTEFQRRCISKMRDVASGGRTVVFVSHNKAAVASLCTRAIWLDGGRVQVDGTVDGALAAYFESLESPSAPSIRDRTDRGGDGRARITNIEFLSAAGVPATSFFSGDEVAIAISYETSDGRPLANAHASIAVESALGERVGLLSSHFSEGEFAELPAHGRLECRIPRLALNTGQYVCTVWLNSSGRKVDELVHAVVFAVEAIDFYGTGRQPGPHWGSFLFDIDWRVDGT